MAPTKEYSRHSADDERSGGARRVEKLKPDEVQKERFRSRNPAYSAGCLDCGDQPAERRHLGSARSKSVRGHQRFNRHSLHVHVTLSYDHRVVDGAIAHQFLHK